ncbi:MAG: UDP-N-acetylmuramate dehydrogenase [Eubacteriales bacterium]|nr:UDP-N-acetylmuramate dehydrogenase [Eubacteriales bacterium]
MLWFESLDKKIEEYLPDLAYEKDVPMSQHTSFRIGGPAKRMAFPVNGEQMVLLIGFAQQSDATVLVIGNGTNLLIADEGLDCLVINTTKMNAVEMPLYDGIAAEDEVFAMAGATLASVAMYACKQGLSGLEFAHGIPGTVGGAVCMNAGAYGGEMKDVLKGAAVLFPDEGIRFLSAEELDLSYRHSLLSERADAVVLYAVFSLQKGEEETIRESMRELMARRKKSQPLEYPSAGSTFKRPTGYFAGTLIEQTGLKGMTVGGAQVSQKHAGFVINTGGATCADVKNLIAQVQDKVYEASGVSLEPEVKIIG